jgi:GNAT superfamily N-acetyltransferase
VSTRGRSYRGPIAEADLKPLSVEDATTDFAEGLAELSSGAAVFVAELTGRVVGYAYVLPSSDADLPAETSELGSLYVTEEVAGTEVALALIDAAIEHSRAAGQDVLMLWVRRENGRARRFYEKHGMREDGTERRRSLRRPADRDERDSLSNVALNPPNSTIATWRARRAALAPGATHSTSNGRRRTIPR